MENILGKIYHAGLKFLLPLTPEETYATIVKEAVRLIKAEFGTILLEEKGELKRVYASWEVMYKIKPRKDGYTYKSLKTNKPIIVNISQIKKARPDMDKAGIKSSIIIPLAYQGRSIGVLIVNSRRKIQKPTPDLDILKLFGSMASLAIRKTQLYDETKKALETRDLFISMAAHELRTPITTINGYVQLLQRKLAESNTTESRWTKELAWETQRLILLVNELLEVNRIKQGQLNYIWKECSIKAIVKRAVSNLSFTHPDRKVIFIDKIGNKSDVVIGDSDKLIQAINNILENAAKFSPPDTEINILLKTQSTNFIIIVKDKGRGIGKKNISKVFDGFYREAKETEEGMGLGLYLAKNIITLHRGSIEIYSKVNKGATVEIKLPIIK